MKIQFTFVFFAFLLFSCSKTIPPIFEKDQADILKDLRELGIFEETAINVRTLSHGQKSTHILIVELLNGKNISEDKMQRKELGKKALQLVIQSIKNEVEYDKFQVILVQNKSVGHGNLRFSQKMEFSLEELNKNAL
jgi:hypothetical protein